MELEQGKNVDFWRDMTTITEDEISKLRKLEASGKGPGMKNCHFVRAEVLHSICLCPQLCFILGEKKMHFSSACSQNKAIAVRASTQL